jgi:hypothetical protein
MLSFAWNVNFGLAKGQSNHSATPKLTATYKSLAWFAAVFLPAAVASDEV